MSTSLLPLIDSSLLKLMLLRDCVGIAVKNVLVVMIVTPAAAEVSIKLFDGS